jgi:ATP/maltotriose-dependent transcriptional regulator MalT/DNA-binding SARP family transcriptional activator
MMVAGGIDAPARRRISRPQVVERIRAALVRGSLLVVADAGFGKTLALEEALSGWRTAAWVSCTAADRDAGRLMMSVLGAFRRAAPGAVDGLAERWTAGAGTVDPVLAARELVADLESLLVETVVVVLDDAEQLGESSGAGSLIAELLRGRSRVRVAVASRREPPLKTAKLQASGAVTILGSEDLAFSAEECERFLTLRLAREARPAEVASAMDATGGWPLGLELGAAAGEPLARGSGPRQAVFEYLAEEVLAAVEPELRERLLVSSVTSELSASLVEALGLPADFLAQAERAGIFLRLADARRGAYRYHPLFREFLLGELHRSRSDIEIRGLHARAAGGLAGTGAQPEAVEHWLAAEEWAGAVASMAAASQGLLRSSPGTLVGWLERLPPSARGSATCLLIEGQLAWSAGENERAIPLLRRAIAALRESGNVEAEWIARMTLADTLFSTGGFEEMDTLADGWDAFDPAAIPLGAVGVAFYRAVGYAIVGRAEESAALIDRLMQTSVAPVFGGWLVPIVQAFTDSPTGRIERLLARMRAGAAELELSDPMGRLAYLLASIALLHMERGEYDTALECWARTGTEATRSGLDYVGRVARFERALILGFQGRREEAELEIERAGPVVGTGWRDQSFEKARAVTASLAGDAPAALAAAERALALAAASPTNFRVWAAVELAPVLEVGGAGGRAFAVVDEVLAAVDDHYPGGRGRYNRARLLAARAWLHDRADRTEQADADIARCFAEAGDATRHVLRREWSRVGSIVSRALGRGLLDVGVVVREVEAAHPGGAALVPLTRHAMPSVRRAAIAAAAASGDPGAITALEEIARSDPGAAGPASRVLERLVKDPPPLAFALLGGFSVTRGSWTADDVAWERRVAQRLVRFLLLHREASVSEDELFEAFWPGRDASSARRSLHVALSSARRVLDVPGAASVIEAADRAYRLRLRASDTVDTDQFEAAARAALDEQGGARERLLERAASLWHGEPLPEERYSDWALSWRARLTDLHAAVLAALADRYLERGELTRAGLRARELVELDPLDEGGHRRLIVAYARAGRRNQALRQYLECRRTLVEQLGVEPAAETTRLQVRILGGDPV